jgi:hypothetical protein
VLDELCIRLMECLLVLQALPDEADLNFDELERDLHVAQQGARLAYGAASLVHQGAMLDERWGTGWSRPKAIFARHSAAVRRGANKINPKPTLSDDIERALWQVPAPDRIEDAVGVRPKCSGTVRATGDKCASSTIYLGSGLFGAHCYSHATLEERDQYRTHHEAVIAQQSNAHAALLGRQRDLGENISERWLQHREHTQQWVDALDLAADAPE